MAKLRIFLVVLAIAAGTWLLRGLQNDVLYYPSKLEPSDVDRLAHVAGWRKEVLQDEVPLVGLVRPAADAQRPWIVFFAGNDMSLEDSQGLLRNIAQEAPWGLAVFAYRGYDGSGGSPTQSGLVHDALAIGNFLTAEHHVTPSRLVVLGYSLGSGVAAQLAAALSRDGTPPAGLVLAAGYTSIARVFDDHTTPFPTAWLAFDPYDTGAVAAQIACPVLLLHGDQDAVIDVHHAHDLATAFQGRAQLEVLHGGRHNNVFGTAQARTFFTGFVQRVVHSAAAKP